MTLPDMAELGRYKVPVELLDLERDIGRLEQVEHILRHIDGRSCSLDFKTGYDILRHILNVVRLCRSQAERKRKEFLKKQ